MAKKTKKKTQAAPVEEKKPMGTLYPSHKEVPKGESTAMFLQMAAGTAKNDKRAYSLGTNMGDGSMIVTSEQTDRKFVLSWQDAIALAVERGIDGTDPIPNPLNEEKEDA